MWSTVLVLLFLATSITAQQSCTTEGSVSLTNAYAGVVQICHNGVWGSICAQGVDVPWSQKNVLVVCRQLNLQPLNPILQRTLPPSWLPSDTTPIHYSGVSCDGTETELQDCYKSTSVGDCLHTHSAAVACSQFELDGNVRLVGSMLEGYGAVEVYSSSLESWFSVCPDDEWTDSEANLVCRQLGFDGGKQATYSISSGNIAPRYSYDFFCGGSDVTISTCYSQITRGGCPTVSSDRYAGVECRKSSDSDGKLRLTGGSSGRNGRVEILYDGRWGFVCDNGWDEEDARVACRDLGFGDNRVSIPNSLDDESRSYVMPIWTSGYGCSSTNRKLADCPQDIPLGYAAECYDYFSNDVALVDCGPPGLHPAAIFGIAAAVFIVVCVALFFIFKDCYNKRNRDPNAKKCFYFWCGIPIKVFECFKACPLHCKVGCKKCCVGCCKPCCVTCCTPPSTRSRRTEPMASVTAMVPPQAAPGPSYPIPGGPTPDQPQLTKQQPPDYSDASAFGSVCPNDAPPPYAFGPSGITSVGFNPELAYPPVAMPTQPNFVRQRSY